MMIDSISNLAIWFFCHSVGGCDDDDDVDDGDDDLLQWRESVRVVVVLNFISFWSGTFYFRFEESCSLSFFISLELAMMMMMTVMVMTIIINTSIASLHSDNVDVDFESPSLIGVCCLFDIVH